MNFFKRFINWLKDTWFIRHISFLWHWKNFFFLLRYPFWKARNVWTGKFLGYAFTLYDEIPEGWRNAFGVEMSDEIRHALKVIQHRVKKSTGKRLSIKELISFQQIKEKWGGLRIYATAPEEVQKIISHYEHISADYCIDCGKPAKYLTTGYILPFCEDCFGKTYYVSQLKEKGDKKTLLEYKKACAIKKSKKKKQSEKTKSQNKA